MTLQTGHSAEGQQNPPRVPAETDTNPTASTIILGCVIFGAVLFLCLLCCVTAFLVAKKKKERGRSRTASFNSQGGKKATATHVYHRAAPQRPPQYPSTQTYAMSPKVTGQVYRMNGVNPGMASPGSAAAPTSPFMYGSGGAAQPTGMRYPSAGSQGGGYLGASQSPYLQGYHSPAAAPQGYPSPAAGLQGYPQGQQQYGGMGARPNWPQQDYAAYNNSRW